MRRALRDHPRKPRSLTPKMYQDIKDTDDIQYLLNLGREEGQIIAKSKMMRTKELEAAKKKKQPPVEKPKDKRKERSNKGQRGPCDIYANKGTTWTLQEEEALDKIHGDVTYDNHAWKEDTIKKWLTWGHVTDEMRDTYTQLKEGRLNDKRSHRDDSAIVSKWNKMNHARKNKADKNENDDEDHDDENNENE